MKVESVLATKGAKVITVGPDEALKVAAALLAEHNIGALVVTDETGDLLGIISERDIVREAARNERVLAQTVRRVMTTDLVTASPQDDVETVMQTMTAGRFRHVPIIERERLIGIVSIGDVVKVQIDKYQGEVETLQTQIMEE